MKRKVCKKAISVFLVIVMVITMLPTMTLHASAEDVPTKVILSNGSLGTADDSKITGLTSGKIYMVTVDPEGTSKIMYTTANGTLTENAEDKAALGENVTEITDLTNEMTYKVEEYTLAEAFSLDVTIAPGTANDSTKVTITESATSEFVVNITDDKVTTPNVEDSVPTGDNIVNPYTSEDDITTGVEVDKWLQVYDVDNDNKVVKFYQKQLTAEDIKTVTEEEQADQAIESAKNLIPQSFTAEEGTYTNLLDYLNGIESMGKTGVTLSLDARGNDNVADDGAITYTDSQITGDVTVKINKTGETEQTKIISVTIPKHVLAVASQLDVTIAPGTANGSTKATITESATSEFVVNITDEEVTTPNEEDSIPTGDNIINPYTSGNDITKGVVADTWLQIYDVDNESKVVRFYQKHLAAEDIKTVTEEEQPNQAIESAMNLIPQSFTAQEGTHRNLLDYLNGIENMSSTGVTLSLDAIGNNNVADDGTITYTDSQIIGDVTVKINKTGGTEQTKMVRVTIPKHVPDVASQLDVTIAPGTANGSTKATITESATSKFIVNITEDDVTTPNEEDSIPTGDNIINPYTSGNDITTGVEVDKWLQVYDVDTDEKVVRFYQKQLTAEDININIIETTGDWDDVAESAVSEGDNPDYQISQDRKTYTIRTAKGLAWIAHQVNDGTNDFKDKTVELTNDIDLMEHFWTPIGIDSKNSFKGIFDGKGYTISNLKIGTKANPNEDIQYIGLFGYVNGSTIQDISIEECVIYSSKENVYAGSLVGFCINGTVKNSYATGTIECSSVSSIAGGLIGFINSCKIMNSYSTDNIKGSSKVGGLIGYSLTSIIINSYATGYVECSDGESGIAGGLVGSSYGTSDKIINSYATGAVEGSGEIGGLLGKSNYDVVINGYWNNELNDKGVGDGYDSTIGLSSTNMGKDNQSNGIDFAKTLNENQSSIEDLEGISLAQWGIDVSKNNGYPIFTGIGEGIGVVPVLIANVTRGRAEGSTKATITGDAVSKFVVDITDNKVNIPKLGDKVFTYGDVVDDYKSEDDVITGVLAGKWLQIYDVDSDYRVVKFYQKHLTKEDVSIGSWADVVESATSEGDNPDYQISQDGITYTIRTSKGLAWLANQVNSGINNFKDKTVELANDIDIGEHFWTPIGIDSHNSFKGIFDGKDYVISNLKIGMKERPDVDMNIKYIGLFGYAYEATIKDVGIEECAIYSAKDSTYIGGLVGYSYNNTITNSYTTGTIENSGEDCDMGGLAGYSNGTIDNSYTIGTIENSGEDSDVGGLAGYSNGTIDNSYTSGTVKSSGNLYKPYVGGLVGHGKGSITNCYVTGCVEGNGRVGALVGQADWCSVNNSYASGDVTGSGSVGGLVGYGNGGCIINSHTTGNVTGGGYNVKVGGVVGESYSMIYNSHSSGNIIAGDGGYAGGLVGTNNAAGKFDPSFWTGRIVNSYATGDVTGGKEAWVGGLSGSCGGVIMNSYATGNITGGDISRVGGLAGYLTFAIMNSYTTGDVKGGENAFVGGVIGDSLKNIDGWNYTELNNVYWNSDAKQTVDSVDRNAEFKKGTGNSYMENKTTGKKKEEMQDKVLMEGVTFTWFLNYNQKDIKLPQGVILQEWGIDASKNNGYPILKALTYSVTYYGNGNTSGDAPDRIEYEAEAEVTVLGKGDLEKTHYTFDGWNTESNGSGDSYDSGQSFKMPAYDLELYAKWTDARILEYIAGANGHIEGNSKQKVKYGENGTEVEAVPNEGYHFVSWSDGETTAKRIDNNVTKNVSVTANFEIDKYRITFNTNGGSSISPSEIMAGYNTKVEKPISDLTKEGYTFEGWYKWHNDSSLNTKWDFESNVVTEDMTLYAKWRPDNPNILTDDDVIIIDGVITKYTGTKTDIIIPSVLACQKVVGIGSSVFQNKSLRSVELPDGVESIESDAFENNGLTSIIIPNSVKTVGGHAFETNHLKSVELSNSLTSIQRYVFSSNELTNIIIPNSIKNIDKYAFCENKLTSIIIPNSVERIGNGTFSENQLTTVTIPVSIKAIGEEAFAYQTLPDETISSDWYEKPDFSGAPFDFTAERSKDVTIYSYPYFNIIYEENDGSPVADEVVWKDTYLTEPTAPTKSGYTFEGWYTDDSFNTKWNFANDRVIGNITLYAKWTKISSGGSSDDSSSHSSSHSHNKNTSEDTVKAETDKGSIDLGKAKVNYNSDGKKETVLAIDKEDVEKIVSKTKDNEMVSIEVGKDTDVVKAQLNVQSIKDMQDKNLTLEVKTDGAIYDLSTNKVDIDDISKEIGKKVELKDIKFSVQISKTNNDMVKVVKDTTNKGGLAIVAPPVDFDIEASYKDKTYKVDKFKGFISRKIEIPEGADVSKITTAVIVEKDGSIRHVPTYVTKIDGKYYANINSFTNSTYTLIYNKETFSDVTDESWAKEPIEKMASRMIIEGKGDGTFAPNEAVTRSDLAKAIVKALGLKPVEIKKFTDIESGSDIAGYIGTAYSYGIINGVNENTFNPKGFVTRQDAMTMIYRASKIVDFIDKGDTKEMSSYIDYSEVSDYAKAAVDWNVNNNIIIGRTDNKLVPFDNITRAELCNVINKFLISVGLIE